ncbi:hypothetical protein SJ_202 [Proteus phage SJ_PmiM]|nr:hypothetical protein SJ_202 [Proteus phage SJ_PmiM]
MQEQLLQVHWTSVKKVVDSLANVKCLPNESVLISESILISSTVLSKDCISISQAITKLASKYKTVYIGDCFLNSKTNEYHINFGTSIL